jgi:hypothetical protein
VKVWHLSDGKHVRDLGKAVTGQSESLHAISISPDGKLLAAADGVGQVLVYALLG